MPRAERSLKNQSIVLKTVKQVGQNKVAEFCEVSEPTISSLLNNQLQNNPEGTTQLSRLCDVLAALDLKVVPLSARCFNEGSIASILRLAKERMDQLESPDQLIWED